MSDNLPNLPAGNLPKEALSAKVDRLSDEALALRIELRRRTHALWVAIVVLIIAGLVVMAGAVAVTVNFNSSIQENNQKWCPMVSLLVPRPGGPQPKGDFGRQMTRAAAKLAQDFGCDDS